MSRFDYVKYDDRSIVNQEVFKSMVTEIETHIETILSERPKALALTALEECYMWIGKGIRDDQIIRERSEP